MIFDTSSLSLPQIHPLLVGGITPRPIAWISSLSRDGVHNIAPYSFFSVASAQPPVLCITQVNPSTGKDKDTFNNLQDTGECVVNIVNQALLDQMNLSCLPLPASDSEFDYAQIEFCESHAVAARSVLHAPVRYECRLRDIITIADTPGAGRMALLDVKYIYVQPSLLNDGKIDPKKLDSVGKLGGDWYSLTSADALKLLPRPNM